MKPTTHILSTLSAVLVGALLVASAQAAIIVDPAAPAAKVAVAPAPIAKVAAAPAPVVAATPATAVVKTAATTRAPAPVAPAAAPVPAAAPAPAPAAAPVPVPVADPVPVAAAPAPVAADVAPSFIPLGADSNLDISFFIVEHTDAKGNSHRFAANKESSSPDATLQGFSMLISTIMPEREIGEITGMFKIGDEIWSFATRSIALINSGRLIVNTRLSVKDKEKGSTELISKEPYMTVKVIGNREQNITEFIDVGVKIEAEPKILADGRVHARMMMSISEVLRENDNSRATRVPVVSYRTVNTSIDFVPGKLELLSELTIQKTVSFESGIPYLRNIPFLGKLLFAHTSKQIVDTKLYIVGGIAAPQEQKIQEYEALKKQIEEERKNNPRFR